MKKAVLISAYDYYDVRVKYIYNTLETKGYSLEYFIASFNHFKKIQNRTCRNEATILKTIGYKKNVSIARIISCLLFSLKAYKKIKKIQPELVYCIIPPNSLSWLLWKGKRKYGYQLILDIFDSWPESFSVSSKMVRSLVSPLFKIWKDLRDSSIVHADMILGVSTEALSVIPECVCPKKLFYPMPREHAELDLAYFQSDKEVSFCYVGGINRLLNMDRIIDILKEVALRKEVHVHIIGNGEKKEDFISKMKYANVHVFDHGVLYEWAKKFPVYSACSFGLNIPIEEAKVTMSLKGAEYLCASLPLLNEAVGDTEALVEKYGAGINTKGLSARSVAEKICALSIQDMIAMKNNAKVLYEKEFESKNHFEYV